MTTTSPASVLYGRSDRIRLGVASSSDDFTGAFSLVHDAYCRAGLGDPHPSGLRVTRHQLLDTSQVFVAKEEDEVISTQTLVMDGELGLPLESLYGAEVDARRAAGARIAEVCCLADRRLSPKRFFELFSALSRVMAQFAERNGVDEMWIVCHPRHAPLYERRLAFERMGALRSHPLVKGNPAVPLRVDLQNLHRDHPRLWDRYFGEPLPADVLIPTAVPAEERDCYRELTLVADLQASSPEELCVA